MFILDEFRVSIGHLPIVNDFWALVRGYGVQFLPVCQSVLQLRALFKEEWENYAGQAGVVVTIGPPGDTATAEWMSKRGGNTTIWQEGWTTKGINQAGRGHSSTQAKRCGQVARPLPAAAGVDEYAASAPGASGLRVTGTSSMPFCAPNYWQRRELEGWSMKIPIGGG